MNREDEKNSSVPNQDKQPINANDPSGGRHEDDDQHSYQGKLDHVEGRMDNGEIGGGIKKEKEA